ncbi:hypothetical protein [Microcystis aeruginosa]|uniref:hypothetical protein n=1 Tax=Microcystis aeruginosa TaxID=1126 RepID=UPI00124C7B78|nr:hypothetical protein [Microcystis aeruginosa]
MVLLAVYPGEKSLWHFSSGESGLKIGLSGNLDVKFPKNRGRIGLVEQERRSSGITDPMV